VARASAADAARTARDVLDAATDLFARRGYADVSLEDVAQAAGVTRGAVYHHFRSRAGLLGAVVGRLQADVADAVVAAAEAVGEDPREQLRAGCHAFLDAITTGPALRVLLVDAPAELGWAQWRGLDAENGVVHLREALARSGVPQTTLDAMTAALSGAMNEAALWVAEHPGADGDAREAARAVIDRLLAAALA